MSKIIAPLHELNVRVLVNNVGVNTEIPSELTDLTYQEIDHMIDVNIRFTSKLTRLMIPFLKNHANPKSAILNISSLGAAIPTPLLSIYAGTKAFNDAFSRSLTSELEPYNIDVMSVLPGYVVSKMSGINQSSIRAPLPDAFGRDVVHKMGLGVSRVVPYFFHDLLLKFVAVIPEWLVLSWGRKQMVEARNKLFAKQKRSKDAAGAYLDEKVQ